MEQRTVRGRAPVVMCFSALMVWLVPGRQAGLTCCGKRTVGGPDGHKQVAHHRCSSCPCADHSLVFAAGLDPYCAHGNPATGHSASAAAIVAARGNA